MTSINRSGTLFTLSEIARATGGVAVRRANKPVRCVSIDSRKTEALSLFVPLAGERVDGHNFIPEALDCGASAVLIQASYWQKYPDKLGELLARADAACVVVDDTLTALQDLARFHLHRFPRLFRIGVTGSSGKTTTKELIGAVLSRHAPVMVSKGNLNSEIGVPLAAFEVEDSHAYAVFEMGINHTHEMDVLVSIVRPNLAVITTIGTAHIGPLGSQDNIATEKKKIASFLKQDEALFVFEDEPYLDFIGKGLGGRLERYGPRHTQGFSGSRDLGLDGTAIDWEGLQIRFPLVGYYNIRNALAAISVAGFLHVPASAIRAGLEEARPLFGRSQILKGKITIIADCYNANPESVQSVLGFLKTISWSGRKFAVLGSMLELGGSSATLHRAVGRYAADCDLDGVFFFGEDAGEAWKAYEEVLEAAGLPARGGWFLEFSKLAGSVSDAILEGDVVLVKGSRALELERLVQELTGIADKGEGS